MRFVLDTNVLMSGIYFGGKPGQVIDWWLDTGADLVVTHAVLAEYQDVFDRLGKRYPALHGKALMQMVIRQAVLVQAAEVPMDACPDVDDVKFLACALAGGSPWIVSGDAHLLGISGWREIQIVTPAEFLRRL